MKTHTALGLREPPFQNEPNKSHIFHRKTQLLLFSRMLAFLTARRASERASGAMVSVSVYAAQLSPFTPFVVVLEREGVLNPYRSTSSKRFSSVSATWTPRPAKVKLWLWEKQRCLADGKRSSSTPHTLHWRIYCLLMGIGEAMRRTGGSQKQYKQVSAPISPVLYGNGAGISS